MKTDCAALISQTGERHYRLLDIATMMLSVWALGHIKVRGKHSLKRRSIGGGGAWQMTKAQEMWAAHYRVHMSGETLFCCCRGEKLKSTFSYVYPEKYTYGNCSCSRKHAVQLGKLNREPSQFLRYCGNIALLSYR